MNQTDYLSRVRGIPALPKGWTWHVEQYVEDQARIDKYGVTNIIPTVIHKISIYDHTGAHRSTGPMSHRLSIAEKYPHVVQKDFKDLAMKTYAQAWGEATILDIDSLMKLGSR